MPELRPTMQTNRLLLILNVVLLAAVVFLFVKVYSGPSAPDAPATAGSGGDSTEVVTNPGDTAKAPVLAAGSGDAIYYVNTDTLLSKYTVFKAQSKALEAKGNRLEQEITRRATALQQEQQTAMQKIQSGQMNQQQAEEADGRLRQKGMELEQYREQQANALVEEQQRQTEKLNNSIRDFLKGFAGRRGYKYVLGYSSAGGILFANDSLDITDAVVAGLNKN